jgi:ATP-dependent RNA helicase DeaD
MAERSAHDIAASLVHAHRARLPEPEELLGNDAPPEPRGPRAGFESSAWFRINVGRNQNAEPRWILPLLCRRGHVSRNEIGAIRLAANETMFEVAGAAASRFQDAVRRTADDEDGVHIQPVDGKPSEGNRRHRRDNARPVRQPKPYQAKSDRPERGKPDGNNGNKPRPGKGPWRKKPGKGK